MNGWLLLAIVSLLVLIVLILNLPAHSHDAAHPELNNWLAGLQSKKGPCCDGSDAKRIDDVDWETRDGHYRVRIDGEWVDVPDEAVVKSPNLAGHTMVWPVWTNGQPTARCFMPGTMG